MFQNAVSHKLCYLTLQCTLWPGTQPPLWVTKLWHILCKILTKQGDDSLLPVLLHRLCWRLQLSFFFLCLSPPFFSAFLDVVKSLATCPYLKHLFTHQSWWPANHLSSCRQITPAAILQSGRKSNHWGGQEKCQLEQCLIPQWTKYCRIQRGNVF